jgi:DNA-nicking Smr family endonuclease
MAKVKGLSKADVKLWAAYSQTLKLLPGKARLAVEAEAEPEAEPAAALPAPGAATPPAKIKTRLPAKPVEVGSPPPGLDKTSWRKFRTGERRASRVLDLHGMTAARAHHATLQFIQAAHAEQLRVVEIITGKGEVLLRELPHWLNAPQLRPLILALAHPHAANIGSVRILLRRNR